MLARQIKHAADGISDGIIDAAGGPGGKSNRRGCEDDGHRQAACKRACHDRRGKKWRLSKEHNEALPLPCR
jgi:hypothetical protein